jgi:copper chaperone CopZ
MKNKPESPDSSLSETMAARIEIKELGDPAHQKKITDAVEALDGVIDTKIAKGALHVSYDPLATTEKKIEEAIRSTGTTIKNAATDTEGAHPDLPTSNVQQAPAQKCGAKRACLTRRDLSRTTTRYSQRRGLLQSTKQSIRFQD